jgi:hypothetical protein
MVEMGMGEDLMRLKRTKTMGHAQQMKSSMSRRRTPRSLENAAAQAVGASALISAAEWRCLDPASKGWWVA